jgi:hypothetical protein
MRHSAATGATDETPTGHRNSPKDRVESPFSDILDAQPNLAVLAHTGGTALNAHLRLNHLLFYAGEDRSTFLESQTQLFGTFARH